MQHRVVSEFTGEAQND